MHMLHVLLAQGPPRTTCFVASDVTPVVYHLHRQTGRSIVWANGTQNSGLLKFRPGLNLVKFTLYTKQFHLPKKEREGLKLVSKMALKKWNTDFLFIQPKSKMSGLNFRQLLVANGTAFSKICNKRGPFHWTKTFENLETAANDSEISRKSFQIFRKLLNFRNANLSTENSRNPRSKVERKENFREKVSENLGILREVVCRKFWKMLFHSLLEVAENSNRTFWLNGKRPRTTSRGIPKCDLTIREKRR